MVDIFLLLICIVAHLYLDWYLGFHIIVPVLSFFLLCWSYLRRSERYPWQLPSAFFFWIAFLLLTIYPAMKGAWIAYDAASYYPSDIWGAFSMCWLGVLVGRNARVCQRFFVVFACLGALLAIHTMIQFFTGVTLFGVTHYDEQLASAANYQLFATDFHRSGSFLIDPNWNGTMLALFAFLTLGLLLQAPLMLHKLYYGCFLLFVLLAMLFTFSNGAWVGLAVGLSVFFCLIGSLRARIGVVLLGLGVIVFLFAGFPNLIALQFQRTGETSTFPLRVAGWQTALNVMGSYPLFGVGLGYQSYMERSEPFRVWEQTMPLAHPHNSYLEWGAMGGIPVMLLFMLILVSTLFRAFYNFKLVKQRNPEQSILFAAGIASITALTVNSVSINGWTHPFIAMLGWLILGVISSPLVRQWRVSKSIKGGSV